MKNSLAVLAFASLALVLLIGCAQPGNATTETNGDVVGGGNNLLGGDRDEHGCIGSAGYTWCEEKQKCLRQWEEKCEGEGNES